MDLLQDSDSSDNDAISFKINKNYAQHYDKWRKQEERQKLIDKYGQDAGDSSSSSEEEEIRTTKQMDKDWLRAYAVVRFNQPRLYKEGEKFFHDEAKPISKKKDKATTLKDHERKFIVEKGGIESDDETSPQPQGKSYFEEQEEIKKSFKDAVEDSSNGDSDDDGLLVRKQKSKEEQDKEENDYLEWLKGNKEELDDPEAAAELAPLKAYWNDPNLDENEKVLRDYVLNNGYMDQEDSEESEDDHNEGPEIDEEKSFLQKAEEYEQAYNFRHEEPGGDEIKSYPRVIETSVRPKDTRRAEARKRKMDKKKQEKDEKMEEIRLLQKLQREEKMEKLDKLRQIASNPDLDYDLDADFDPNEHSKIMAKYFDDDYYGDSGVEKKPEFEYDAAIDDDADDFRGVADDQHDEDDAGSKNEQLVKPGTSKDDAGSKDEQLVKPGTSKDDDGLHAEDPDFIMDADFDPTRDYKAEKRRARKYGKAFAKKLPLFDPATKTFDEYIDEYLKDKINTLPFTYREVVPNDFGLSTEEILKAPERELNAWVSVKKMSQYRSRQEEISDVRKFAARARDGDKKFKVLPSLLKKSENIGEDGVPKKKKKKKRKKNKTDEDDKDDASADNSQSTEKTNPHISNGEASNHETKTKKRKIANAASSADESMRKKAKLVTSVKEEDSESESPSKSLEKNKLTKSPKSVSQEGDKSHKVKKKKKLKQKGQTKEVKDAAQEPAGSSTKKKKRKKISIANFGVTDSDKTPVSSDPKEVKKRLENVLMSSSRMSKYGLTPSNMKKGKGKRKKKLKKTIVDS